MFSRAKLLAPILILSATGAWAFAANAPAEPVQVQSKDTPEAKKEAMQKEALRKKELIKKLEMEKKIKDQKALKEKQAGANGKKKSSGSRPKILTPPASRKVGGGKPTVISRATPEQLKKEAAQKKRQAPMIQADPGAKLKIEFGTERHDFGKVRQGDQVNHSFTMQAAGTTPLKIRQVKPSCGCTVGSVQVADAEGNFHDYTYGDPIQPGRQIIVGAAVNTTNKKNKAQVRVQIMSNDPAGTHSLTLAAEVQPFLIVTPPLMNFGDIPMGGQRDQRVDIRTSRGEGVKMHIDPARLGTLPQGVNVALTAMNPDAEGKSAHWTVDVTIDSSAKEGQANAALRILTDIELPIDEKKREKLASTGQPIIPQYFSANLSVQARILGSFSLDRPYLSFGLVRPGQITPRVARLTCNEENFNLGEGLTVEVRGKNGAAFEFADLFETSIRPVPGASAVDIELRLKGFPDGVDKSFSGELLIRTGHPSSPDKIVRFSGVCRSGVSQR
ncbi:MAG: DUF1573 domain-containing protein [Planctomycetota bacterium]|nr:DUF1573 domain-containing protein [Planctomycetota bacterium]